MEEKTISWGIIGCGDVAEVKSGPAFQLIKHSELVAVMRRNEEKAASFAKRHNVAHYYSDVESLLRNEKINAIYIATPPSSHLGIALKCLRAGKMVYLEKPMTLNLKEAHVLVDAVNKHQAKLSVAHYRRALPSFQKVGELLREGAIGKARLAEINIRQPMRSEIIAETEDNWRVRPKVSGGGYFYDLAPHQLDLMLHYFGEIEQIEGFASNQSLSYEAEDIVTGIIKFKNKVHFTGTWIFNIHEGNKEDLCTVYGEHGAINFSFYGDRVHLDHKEGHKTFTFENPKHIQMPMIQEVVNFFRDQGPNPCSVEEGMRVMEIMDRLSK